LINKKVSKILSKLANPKPSCVGCFGTGKFHASVYGKVRVDCKTCNTPGCRSGNYNYYFSIYTKECKCLWHVNYNGDLVIKNLVIKKDRLT